MNAHTEWPPGAAVEHFAQGTSALTWHRAAPGFSGAVVWRGDAAGAPRVALKGWPHGTTVERVEQVHLWMARAAHLPFVPNVFAPARGRSAVVADGRVWDACHWMPGTPLAAPTADAVRAACAAVARLHLCWPAGAERRPCRGVAARLDMLTDHRALLESWNRAPLPPVAPELDPLLRRAAREVARVIDAATRALRPWAAWPLAQQPCVRDLRGEHVLFEGERVSGVIDYGAMAVDHVAVDLARLLGDYASTDDALFAVGLDAYRAAGAPLDVPDALVQLLARTGAVCSLLGWLVRIFVRREPVLRPAATAIRLEELLSRVERVEHFGPL